MPFTPNRSFLDKPRMVASAQGLYLTTDDGRQIIDATAGLWCSNLGHCRPEIADAVHRQLKTLDYTSIFNFGHQLAFDYAQRLTAVTPDPLNHVFFGNSGSEAVETAMKLALQYWQTQGKSQKTRFIGREKGYHGVNFGGISVGGITPNFSTFGQWLPVDHLGHTLDLERNAFSRGLPMHGVEMAEELEHLLSLHGPDTIAAVIIEPIAGAGGVILPPEGYLPRIRDICTQHDVLLIFDEVITGWGRLGSPFAAIEFGVVPDLMTSAKGISNATIPLSAVFISDQIYGACMENAKGPVEFYHGYTYSAHPAACAAGMAALDLYENEDLLTRASGPVGQHWEDALHSLADIKSVIDVRNYGLIGAIELSKPGAAPGSLGPVAQALAWEEGLMLRGIGDTIAMSPPLIITPEEIDAVVKILQRVITSM
ncbi:MAG: aminotransferase class III-fold pyridoxal phosphate-dependent enzyme [Pseudomonadota bacterium]